MRWPISVLFTLAVMILCAPNSKAQAATSECNPGPVSITFLTKPGDGWDVTFAKQASVIRNGPFILSNGKDSGLTFVEYESKKQVITLPHIEVNPCDHTGTIRYWYLIPKQVLGFEKSGHLFAYEVSVQMMAGPELNSQVIGSNTHVIFYDMHGDGIFDSVRLGAGVGMPLVPDWVKSPAGKNADSVDVKPDDLH